MGEISDMKIFYHKLHKYRKFGEKLLAISVKRSDGYTFGLENKISELHKFIIDNLEKINYNEDITLVYLFPLVGLISSMLVKSLNTKSSMKSGI